MFYRYTGAHKEPSLKFEKPFHPLPQSSSTLRPPLPYYPIRKPSYKPSYEAPPIPKPKYVQTKSYGEPNRYQSPLLGTENLIGTHATSLGHVGHSNHNSGHLSDGELLIK